jgi:hypothetical protein
MEIYRELYQTSKDLREFTNKVRKLHRLLKPTSDESLTNQAYYMTWKQYRKLLEEQLEFVYSQNGLSVCKNCGLDYEALIKNIGRMIKAAEKEAFYQANS